MAIHEGNVFVDLSVDTKTIRHLITTLIHPIMIQIIGSIIEHEHT